MTPADLRELLEDLRARGGPAAALADAIPDRLVRELESRPGPRCVYVKTSVGRLKIVPDTTGEAPT